MPQGIQIGPFLIRFYALFIITGALIGTWLASKLAEKDGQEADIVWDMLPWILIVGIIGSRLWHVFTPSASNAAMGITTANYLKHPLQILEIWKGGLGIPGGVIGGAIALVIYCHIKKLHFGQWTDYIAPGLLIAQGVGRWGNFVNQELYGSPSNLPWAIKIAPEYRLPGFEAVETFHPLFFYEFALNLIAAGILLLLTNANRKNRFLLKGDIFLLYLVFYPVIRFGLEFLRLDPSAVSGYNINQTIMGIVAILAIIALVARHALAKRKNLDVETEGLDLTKIKPLDTDATTSESEPKDQEAELEEITDKELTEDLDELSKLD